MIVSACSSQTLMSISLYMVVAVVRSSRDGDGLRGADPMRTAASRLA